MTLLNTDFRAAAAAEFDQMIQLRRAIHSDPELGLHCTRTTQKLKAAIADLPLEIRDSRSTSGFMAILRGAQPGRTVLLRGDMDALPIREETGLPFASTVEGNMHACGHDTHSAMLASAARILCAQQASLAGTIVFMFQPGEEGHHGARFMIEDGLLDDPKPDAAFALHIFPNIAGGVVTTRPGALLASTDALNATIRGRGGHAAMPYDAIDPIPVACEAVSAAQAFIARRTPFFDPAILSVTQIHAGTAYNIVPDTVEIKGTLRTLSDERRDAGKTAFERIVTQVAAAHECTAEVRIDTGYPACVNDPRAARLISEVAADLFGAAQYAEMPTPIMGGEDFAYVLQKVPGAMAFLGVAPPGEDPAPRAPLHNGKMTIHEDWLARGVALHCAFATRFLASGWE
ncbi:M20 family metallopeptidase [Sphingomonas sp. KRR8]|uniref:M20 metallopeptidase family protein n=1 Tax=Sphingomonas sp. KRR8 TaxID=2942996 RepID=UPI0020216C90|nr:M20 family metallopeptidase [Sphingomonas sp. KRR8]URD59738.1 M20 family metallopeptidase [Sphingomonas sp. KRR8]